MQRPSGIRAASASLLVPELELAVTQGVVDACHRGPELAPLEQPGHGEGGLLTRVGVGPLARADLMLGVGRVLQRVILGWPRTVLDLPDLLPDGDHRIAEAVELRLVLRLCGLHHQGVGHGPGHCRRVEAVVLQPLRNILLNDARLPPEVRAVNDELMRAPVVRVGGNNGVVGREPGLHVICVEDGIPRRVCDAPNAEHRAEHPRDARDAGLAPGGRGDRAQIAARGGGNDGVVRQVRGQVLAHADGAEARATAAMRDAEGLVEVKVADIRTDHSRRGQAELCIHVGPVHVNLATIVMDYLANLLDVVLEEGTCGRVRDHEGRQVILVFLAHLLEFPEVHAPRVINPFDLHVAHGRGGGVGAVRRPGDDAHVAVALTLRLEVLPDHQQASILS
mmetsp:Transcript_69105/g.205648  ORF Transcript_69105/g.205648 Transcript_69105/m.205648 type:complete len:393 (-) Transcript_69105:2027-3205(-)